MVIQMLFTEVADMLKHLYNLLCIGAVKARNVKFFDNISHQFDVVYKGFNFSCHSK